MAQEQSGGVNGRDDYADKSCSDGHFGVVRSDAVQCLEEPLSHNPLEHQNRGSSPGTFGMVSNSQPVVEVHHRHSPGVVGGGGDLKQAEEAISRAPLQRIRMDFPRTEDCGFQGVGFSSHGKSPTAEIDLDTNSNQELRFVDMLQRGYDGDSQVFDGMETGVEFVQGSSEENGLDHDRCGIAES